MLILFNLTEKKISKSPDDDPQCTAAKKIMAAVKLAGVSYDENRMWGDFNLKLKQEKVESVNFGTREKLRGTKIDALTIINPPRTI